MHKSYRAIAALAVLAGMMGCSDPSFSETKAKSNTSAVASFVYVPSDMVLKQMGQTRGQWNKANPPSKKRWMEAWAAKGTGHDNSLFVSIRQESAAPLTADSSDKVRR